MQESDSHSSLTVRLLLYFLCLLQSVYIVFISLLQSVFTFPSSNRSDVFWHLTKFFHLLFHSSIYLFITRARRRFISLPSHMFEIRQTISNNQSRKKQLLNEGCQITMIQFLYDIQNTNWCRTICFTMYQIYVYVFMNENDMRTSGRIKSKDSWPMD